MNFFPNLLNIFYNHKFFSIGILVVFFLLFIGLIFGFIAQHQINHGKQINEIPLQDINLLISVRIIFSLGIIFLIVMVWLNQKYDWKASDEIVHHLYQITETDLKTLSNSISQLAQGDLSTSINIEARSLPEQEMQADIYFIDMLNIMVEGLQKCAYELNTLTDIPSLRLCYIGADSFLEGQRCGQVMGQLLEGEGDVIIFVGSFKATHLELRRKGFENAIHTNFRRIRILNVFEDRENPEITYKCVLDSIDKHPQLKGIYITTGATPFGAARAVRDRNKSDQIKIVGHDLTDSTMEYLSKGLIHATLDQNPYAQGYNPVILMYNYLIGEWEPFSPRLLTNLNVVTPENYEKFWHKEHGIIQSPELLNQLARLSNKSSEKPLKIAVLCLENSAFWIPVKAAVMNAKEQLLSRNTIVDWISISDYTNLMETASFRRQFEAVLEQNYDGITTIVPDRHLVPLINQAVLRGIPVITFNSEPVSLQGLIRAISDQAEKFIEFSKVLGDNSQQAHTSTRDITDAIRLVSEGSISQNNQVAQTKKVLDDLLTNINQVNLATEDGAKATSVTANAIADGAKSMEKILDMVKNVEQSVSHAWQNVEALGKHSERIDAIIELIQDITSRVNVLALNAAIEATQAGGAGRGFMVVANEVRRLARNAEKATNEVTRLINLIKGDILKIEKVMKTGLAKVKESTLQTSEAQNSLHQIRSLAETDQSRLKSIADAVMEIKTYSYRVEEAMNHVTEISDRNNQSVQDVKHATQDMALELDQVEKLSNTLEIMALSELELLGKFNVSTQKLKIEEGQPEQ